MVDKSTSRITKQKEHLQISVLRGGVSQKTVKIKKKETNIPQYIKRKKNTSLGFLNARTPFDRLSEEG